MRTNKISRFDKLNIEGYLFIKRTALKAELQRLQEEAQKIENILEMIDNYKQDRFLFNGNDYFN